MNTVFRLLLVTVFFSCKPTGVQHETPVTHYKKWEGLVSKLLLAEIPKVCGKSWPVAWGECSVDTVLHMDYIKSIDIYSNIIVIDSLVNAHPYTKNKEYDIIVVEQFADGFNAWHCAKFLISQGNTKEISGVEVCRSSPDRDPYLLKQEKANKEGITLTEKEMRRYWDLKTGSFLSMVRKELGGDFAKIV